MPSTLPKLTTIYCLLLTAYALLLTPHSLLQTPPATPTILEPSPENNTVHHADVHMETAPAEDPDGDGHSCSDWEIRLAAGELVWHAPCQAGTGARHMHLGDGRFTGPYTGRLELEPDTAYILRVRHLDDSPNRLGSLWAERPFFTAPATVPLPLTLQSLAPEAPITWQTPEGASVIFPAASGAILTLGPAGGPPLLTITPGESTRHDPLTTHTIVRLDFRAALTPLQLPTSELRFTAGNGVLHTLYLPPINLSAGESIALWSTLGGNTYYAEPGALAPDFSRAARASLLPWRAEAPGFVVDVVAEGLLLPIHLAFPPENLYVDSPDAPLLYVSELYGGIKSVLRDGSVVDYSGDLLNFVPTGSFPGSGEQGVAGLAVDPEQGDLIVTLLVSADPDDANAERFGRVLRLRSAPDGRTAVERHILIDFPDAPQAESHQISNVSFGPDGKLYVHMGDGFEIAAALNLDDYRGKVLRLNPDGSIPADNPFYDPEDGLNARDALYAFGFRNPFGGAWRAADGRLYVADNGPAFDRLAGVQPGTTYGWNGSEGSMFVNSLYVWQESVAPVGVAVIQPQTYGGSGFASEHWGRVFVAETGPTWATGPQERGKRIVSFGVAPDGSLADGPRPLVVYDGSGKGTAVGLAAGPDGLYFTELWKDLNFDHPTNPGARILRVRQSAFADFIATPLKGAAPLEVQFTDVSSVTAAAGWDWAFGDGTFGSGRQVAHTYDAPGAYTVTLTVAGPAGQFHTRRPALVVAEPARASGRIALAAAAGALLLGAAIFLRRRRRGG